MFHLNFKSMTLYKSKIIYLILGLITFFAVFFIAPQSTNACGVQLNSSFRFRTSAGLNPSQPANWYDDENRPFVYLDFKRQGECDNTSQMYLTVFGISPNDYLPVKKTIFNYVIDVPFLNANNGEMTLAFKAGEGPCFGALDNSSDSNCFIFAMITDLPTDNSNSKVLGILGNLIADIPQTQASIFADSWGNGSTSPNTTNCNNIAGYFYVLNQSCPWVSTAFTFLFSSNHKQKLIDYYNTYSNGGYAVTTGDTPSASIAYPAFFYKCDGFCDPASSANDEDHWKDVPSGTLPYGATHPSDQGAVNVNPLPSNYQTEYIPLAPLPFEGLSGGATPSLGEYLASIFRMAIVVIVILAVIMIVFHGIAYATTGAINKKDDHREGVKNAILGLVLALGSWLLLNTISPRLASQLSIGIPMVELTADQQLYAEYEQQTPESGESFVLNGTFQNPQTSSGLSSFLDTISEQNPIASIVVNTSVPNMTITSSVNSSVVIPVTGLGANGVSQIGQGVSGDRKTPKGQWQTTNRTKVAQNMSDAQVSQGGFSMGPAFIGTNITTSDGKIRGIWIHGNRNNNPGPTMGCIRLKNDDVLALARKVNPGISLVIQ